MSEIIYKTRLEVLLHNTEMCRRLSSRGVINPTQGIVADIAEAIYQRAQDEVSAVNTLLRAGPINVCWIHARVLWEQMVNIAYIAREPEERAQRFLSYYIVLSKKWSDACALDPRFAAFNEDGYGDMINAYHAELIGRFPQMEKSRTWSGKSLRQMAKEIGAEADYPIYYSYLSQHAHPSIAGVGHPEMNAPSDAYLARMVEKLTAFSAARLGRVYAELLNFDPSPWEKLEKVIRQSDEFWGPTPPAYES